MAATTQAVYTQAQTEAMMDALPVVTEKRGEVHITLVFDGVAINPGTLFDHLKDIGTIQTDMVPAGNRFNFIVS